MHNSIIENNIGVGYYNLSIYDIFSNREILKKLIIFLNENHNIKYTEIKNYFEISRWVMTTLKK